MHLVAKLTDAKERASSFSVDAAKALFRRGSERKSLTLTAVTSSLSAGEGRGRVVVRDISAGGLLMEAEPHILSTGDQIEIILPEAGMVRARVVWQSGGFFGCQFSEAVSVGAVSAALLRSEPLPSAEIEPPKKAQASSPGRGGAIEPQLNFSVALGLSLALWGVIISAVYFFIM